MDKKTISLYSSWKSRCKQRDKINTFTIEEYAEFRKNLVCFYTGVALIHSNNAQDKRLNIWTLDRIDSSIGYIHGNVVVCSLAANCFKNEYFELIGCKTRETKMLEAHQMYQMIKKALEPALEVVHVRETKFRQILKIIFS